MKPSISRSNLGKSWLGIVICLAFAWDGPRSAMAQRASTESTPSKRAAVLDAIATLADQDGRVDVLLEVREGRARSQTRVFLEAHGAKIAQEYRLKPELCSVQDLPVEKLADLAALEGVGKIYPDQVRYPILQESIPLIDADSAILAGFSDGTGVTVCVLDTGLNKPHPAFAGALVAEKDFFNNDTDATDDVGHGTHVAGIVLSRDATFPGVAPGASLAVGKVCGPPGCSDSDIIAAIDWCVLDVGGDVINMSLGGGTWPGSCDFDALAQVVNTAVDAGVVNVVASGNDGEQNQTASPGCARRAITVGATYDAALGTIGWCLNAACTLTCTDSSTAPDDIVCFSNGSPKLSLVAPGSSIRSANGVPGSTNFVVSHGTSMATPHVAGLVARIIGEHPTFQPNDVYDLLTGNARDLEALGFDDRAGHGRIDAFETLNAPACALNADCNNADPCTTDVCDSGFCRNWPSCPDACTSFDDGLACTVDTCDPCTGPIHTVTGSNCNPTCSSPLPVHVGQTVSGDTSGSTDDYNTTCPGFGQAGPDLVYRIHLTPDQPVNIKLTPTTSWDPTVYLLMDDGTGNDCAIDRCVGGMDATVNLEVEEMVRTRVPVEGDYYIIVDTFFAGATGAFTLEITATCDPEDEGQPCDDGNACTGDDTCSSGLCAGTETGCGGQPDGTECDDGDACTTGDVCSGGNCTGNAVDCDDGNDCTEDMCVADSCMNEPTCDIEGKTVYNQIVAGPADSPDPTNPIDNVDITLSGDSTDTTLTAGDGTYSFLDDYAGSITLTPSRAATDDEIELALSALDASNISKASVELLTFTPKQFEAGDVTDNGTLSALDAAMVAQRAIGIITSFDLPNSALAGASWFFVPVARTETVDTIPGVTDVDFCGVIYGDVSMNWSGPATAKSGSPADEFADLHATWQTIDPGHVRRMAIDPSPEATLHLSRGPQKLQDGSYELVLGMSRSDGILGLDLSLSYDRDSVSIESLTPARLAKSFQLDTKKYRNGTQRVSLFSPIPMQGDGDVLVVRLRIDGPWAGLPFTVEGQANEGAIRLRLLQADDSVRQASELSGEHLGIGGG